MEVRTLRLSEMITQQKGSFTRRLVHLIISVALRLFFYRIQISRAELVPKTGPLIFVLNHPNGLIDPAMVFCALPRRVSFLAKSTLFTMPGIRWLLGVVEALPLYRQIDQAADRSNNQRTFAACYELLQRGRCIALFPEGISHRGPALQPLKTGAARIALGALAMAHRDTTATEHTAPEHSTKPVTTPALDHLLLIPAGLYYTSRTPFRGEALLQFGEPLVITPPVLDATGEPPRAEVRALTNRIAAALHAVTLNFADVEEQAAVAKAETIVSAGYRTLQLQRSLLEEFRTRVQLALGRRLQQSQMPERLQQLETRLQAYAQELSALGLQPDHLQIWRHSRRALWGLGARALLLFLLFPFAWLGLLLHAPAYLICEVFAHFFRTHGPDEGRATAKVLAAIMFMPLTWLVLAGLVWWQHGWLPGLVTLPLTALLGYCGLRWVEEVYDLRGWLRALLILWRRRRQFLRLVHAGHSLQQELHDLSSNETGTTSSKSVTTPEHHQRHSQEHPNDNS